MKIGTEEAFSLTIVSRKCSDVQEEWNCLVMELIPCLQWFLGISKSPHADSCILVYIVL